MENCDFKIAIIGLGIIGGSLAYALRGFKNASIWGFDVDPATLEKALEKGAVDFAADSPYEAIQDADLVVLCTYPDSIVDIITKNKNAFKKGAIITDVCGVKSGLVKRIEKVLPKGCQYIGSHPMAGKETHGFDSASGELFGMCGFIITPSTFSTPDGLQLIKDMAHFIGATRITVASPEEHDSVIAYTSDLMHVSAAALCLEYNQNMNRAYTAGAFRDCTRIANINPELWSGLFLENRDFLLKELDQYIHSLVEFKEGIENCDRPKLNELLSKVRKNKLYMQKKEPDNI